MKKTLTLVIAMLSLTVCHAQSRDYFKNMKKELDETKVKLKAEQEKTKAATESLLNISKLLEVKGAKVDDKNAIHVTADMIRLAVRSLQTQNERKTETLADITKTLTEKHTGVKEKAMTKLSKEDQNTLAEKMKRIKDDLDRVFILDLAIKDLRKKLKAAQK